MAKIKAELVALADYAMTGEDKKLSVIGIFDKLFVINDVLNFKIFVYKKFACGRSKQYF